MEESYIRACLFAFAAMSETEDFGETVKRTGEYFSYAEGIWKTTANGLCVALRSLRSLRLKNEMEANIVADKDADLCWGRRKVRKERKETQRGWG